MSNVDVKSVLDAIAEGEAAKVRVPQIEADLSITRRDLEKAQADIQSRELAIIKYKEQIDALQAKNRSLEVERDDAGFRELEAQDKLTNMLSTLHGVLGTLGTEVSKLEPKPEPIVEKAWEIPVSSVVEVAQSLGQEAIPTGVSEAPKTIESPTVEVPLSPAPYQSVDQQGNASMIQGQSEAGPTTDATSMEAPYSPPAETNSGSAPQVENASSRPFLYRSYTSKPDDMSWSEWTAKGGDAPPWAA